MNSKELQIFEFDGGEKQVDKVKNEEYVLYSRCKQEVYKEAIVGPFCKFGLMVWLKGEIDESWC